MNPFLPLWEYTPDGEPHIFGDRIYLFGSHDTEGGVRYCSKGDYVGWSAPLDDLSDGGMRALCTPPNRTPTPAPVLLICTRPMWCRSRTPLLPLLHATGTAALYLIYHGEGPADLQQIRFEAL